MLALQITKLKYVFPVDYIFVFRDGISGLSRQIDALRAAKRTISGVAQVNNTEGSNTKYGEITHYLPLKTH